MWKRTFFYAAVQFESIIINKANVHKFAPNEK